MLNWLLFIVVPYGSSSQQHSVIADTMFKHSIQGKNSYVSGTWLAT